MCLTVLCAAERGLAATTDAVCRQVQLSGAPPAVRSGETLSAPAVLCVAVIVLKPQLCECRQPKLTCSGQEGQVRGLFTDKIAIAYPNLYFYMFFNS